MKTKIEWAGDSWNFIRAINRQTIDAGWHCVKVSTECANCYAEAMNKWQGTHLPYTAAGGSAVNVYIDRQVLLQPLTWQGYNRVFPCSMTDLFGDFVDVEWIYEALAGSALVNSLWILDGHEARVS